MFQVYNMGHRLEIFCSPRFESTLLDIADEFHIEAKVIGRTEDTESENGKNQLQILSNNEVLKYG